MASDDIFANTDMKVVDVPVNTSMMMGRKSLLYNLNGRLSDLPGERVLTKIPDESRTISVCKHIIGENTIGYDVLTKFLTEEALSQLKVPHDGMDAEVANIIRVFLVDKTRLSGPMAIATSDCHSCTASSGVAVVNMTINFRQDVPWGLLALFYNRSYNFVIRADVCFLPLK